MAGRNANIADSVLLSVTVSEQTARLLKQLAARGIYGRGPSEVACRFIDQALERFTDAPKLPNPGVRKAKAK